MKRSKDPMTSYAFLVMIEVLTQIYFLFPWINTCNGRFNVITFLWKEITTGSMRTVLLDSFPSLAEQSAATIDIMVIDFHFVFFAFLGLQIVEFLNLLRLVIRRNATEIDIRLQLLLWALALEFPIRRINYDMWYDDRLWGEIREVFGANTFWYLFVLLALRVIRKLFTQSYEEWEIIYQQMREEDSDEKKLLMEKNLELIHDFKNHMIVLDDYAREEEYDKLREYLKKLGNTFFKEYARKWTDHRLLNLLINQKWERMDRMDIKLNVQTSSGLIFELEDNELSALFGNILDNAIEACEYVEEGKRWITLKVKQQGKMTFIQLSNSMGQKPMKDGGHWLTTKRSQGLHGYGLRSVERIVKKRDGSISFEEGEETFQVNISFLGQEVEEPVMMDLGANDGRKYTPKLALLDIMLLAILYLAPYLLGEPVSVLTDMVLVFSGFALVNLSFDIYYIVKCRRGTEDGFGKPTVISLMALKGIMIFGVLIVTLVSIFV